LSFGGGLPTMSVMLRRALLASLVAVAVGCLTACGVANTVQNAVDPVAAAATKTERSGGYKTTMSLSVSAAGKQFTMTGSGAFSPDSGELDLNMADLFGQLGGSNVSDTTMKAIYVKESGDPVMYMQLGFLTAFLPGGKSWIRLDLADAGKAAGVDLKQLMGATQNPSDWLAVLQGSGDFTKVGSESIDGVNTTHYHGTVDLRKAAEATGLTADAMQRLLDLGAPSEYPVDVWVDDSGYVRQFQASYDEKVSGQSMSTTMTMGMSDYGTDVEISAPPADQVFDATSLAKQGISSALGGSTK